MAEICADAGVAAYETDDLSGLVRGFAVGGAESGRASLQPLMLAHGFDAVERDGVLRFVMRNAHIDARLSVEDLAVAEKGADVAFSRAAAAELPGRIRLSHVEAGGDYATRTAETIAPGAEFQTASDSELAMLLNAAEGRAMVDRWLSEAFVSRETVQFSLPPSLGNLGPGDIVELQERNGTAKRWRIDRAERAGSLTVEAVRVEDASYRPAHGTDDDVSLRAFVPPIPVWPVFLDLPLLRGDEVPHAPHLAVAATPWPGSVAVWAAPERSGGYRHNVMVGSPSAMGTTLEPLSAARPGVWDRGQPLRIRLKGGEVESVSEAALLGGANLMAIGDGSAEGWELFQFRDARLVASGTWEVSMRLRGQAGTDAFMPDVWPSGSTVVLLDGAAVQVDLPPSARNQMRYWRIGPAMRSHDDPSYRAISGAFRGAGLRPFAPCHLSVSGSLIMWTRRGRVDADGWEGADVPLGETREQYSARLVRDGAILAEALVEEPRWNVPAATWDAVRVGGRFAVEIAQLSESFGAGPYARMMINV